MCGQVWESKYKYYRILVSEKPQLRETRKMSVKLEACVSTVKHRGRKKSEGSRRCEMPFGPGLPPSRGSHIHVSCVCSLWGNGFLIYYLRILQRLCNPYIELPFSVEETESQRSEVTNWSLHSWQAAELGANPRLLAQVLFKTPCCLYKQHKGENDKCHVPMCHLLLAPSLD